MGWSDTLLSSQTVPVHELIAALRAERIEEVSAEALLAMGGPHAAQLLREPNPKDIYWVRSWAARALRYRWHDAALEPLLTAARDPHWWVRLHALRTLGAHAGLSGLEALTEGLKDASWRVREAAALGLGRLRHPETLPALEAAFWDSHEHVQAAIERALEQTERAVRRAAEENRKERVRGKRPK